MEEALQKLPPTRRHSLSSLTSHLTPSSLRRGLRPARWTSNYLAALNISVRTGIPYKTLIPPTLPLPDCFYRVEKQYTAMINALSSTPHSCTPTTCALTDDGYFCESRFNSGDFTLGVIETLTTHLLKNVTPAFTRVIDPELRSTKDYPMHIKYRSVFGQFNPTASLHRKVKYWGAPPWTIPVLMVFLSQRKVNHYAQEVAYLLSLAQHHFAAAGPDTTPRSLTPYRPYVLTIRGETRVSIVTAMVYKEYLDSIEKMEPRRLEVVVSEEFNLLVTQQRVRFVAVYEELLKGLISRDGLIDYKIEQEKMWKRRWEKEIKKDKEDAEIKSKKKRGEKEKDLKRGRREIGDGEGVVEDEDGKERKAKKMRNLKERNKEKMRGEGGEGLKLEVEVLDTGMECT